MRCPPQRPQRSQVCATHVDGLNVFYSTIGSPASPNVIALFAHHTRLLGANPADWTTQPFSQASQPAATKIG
ncbi:MAG: hypothetical protein ACRDRJ_12625 [Streptosporangiaceae bacterium]